MTQRLFTLLARPRRMFPLQVVGGTELKTPPNGPAHHCGSAEDEGRADSDLPHANGLDDGGDTADKDRHPDEHDDVLRAEPDTGGNDDGKHDSRRRERQQVLQTEEGKSPGGREFVGRRVDVSGCGWTPSCHDGVHHMSL